MIPPRPLRRPLTSVEKLERIGSWVAYADHLEAEIERLLKQVESGDEARRVLDLLRSYRSASCSLTSCCRPDEPAWRFDYISGVLTLFGKSEINQWTTGTGDTPEAAILAALEEKP